MTGKGSKLAAVVLIALVVAGGAGYWLLSPRTPSEIVNHTAQRTSLSTTASYEHTPLQSILSIEPSSGTPGTIFCGMGSGFIAREMVNLTISAAESGTYELSIGYADSEGRIGLNVSRISKEIPMPLGDLTLQLRGFTSGVSKGASVHVIPLMDKATEGGFKFSRFSTEHARVMFESRVPLEYAFGTGNHFEFTRWFIGRDFGVYPPRVFKIYIFAEQQGLVRGLVNLAGYTTEQAGFFKKEGIIPMPVNWAQYMTPVLDMRGFSHEYTHTMIEALTGKDSRIAFKWLDEGLAEYEGNACRARLYADAAAAYWYTRRGAALDAYHSGQLFKLRDISTEPEWSNRIQKSDFEFDLEYAEALVAVTKLMGIRGFSSFLKFLREWHTTKHFARQFENAFGLSLDEFESEFMIYVDEQSLLPPPEFSVIVRLANTGIRYSTYLGFHPWFVNPNVYYTTSAGLISGSFAFDVQPNGTVRSLDTRLPLWQHQSNGENYPYLYVLVYSSPGNPNGAEALAVYARYGVAIAAYRYYWYSNTSAVTYLRDFPLQPFPDGNGIIVVPKQSEVPSTRAVFTSTLGEFGAHESSPALVMAKTDTTTLQIVWAIKDVMRRGLGTNPRLKLSTEQFLS